MIIVSVVIVGILFLFLQTEKDKQQRLWLRALGIAGILLVILMMSPIPYMPAMFLMVVMFIVLADRGVPITSIYYVLTALIPVMTYWLSAAGMFLMSISVPMLAGLTIFLLRATHPKQFVNIRMQPADIAVAAFIIAHMILSTRGESGTATLRALLFDVMLYGGVHLLATRARLPSGTFMLKAMAFVGTTLAFIAIFETLRHWPQFAEINGVKNLDLRTMNKGRAGMLRSFGPFFDSISFGQFLAMSLLPIWALWQRGQNRLILSGLIVIAFCGIAAPFSRNAVLAAGVALLVFALLRRRITDFAVVGLAGAVGLVFLTAVFGHGAGASDTYRSRLLAEVPKLLRLHPWTGDNMALHEGKLSSLVQGEGIVDLVNSYLQLGVEGGLILVLSFVAMPILAILSYRALPRRIDPDQKLLAQVVLAQLLGLMVGLGFTSLMDKLPVYVVLLSGLLTGIRVNARLAEPRRNKAVPVRPLSLDDGLPRLPTLSR